MVRRVFAHRPVKRLALAFAVNLGVVLLITAGLAAFNASVRERVERLDLERRTVANQVFLVSHIVDKAESYADSRDRRDGLAAAERLRRMRAMKAELLASRRCGMAAAGALDAPPIVVDLYLDGAPSLCVAAERYFNALQRLIDGTLTRRIAVTRLRAAAPIIREKLIAIDRIYAAREADLRRDSARVATLVDALTVGALLLGGYLFMRLGVPVVAEALDRAETAAADLRTEAAEARRARDAAEEASRFKTEFLARLSHEVRTPLNAILGLSSLILPERLHPADRDRLNLIRANGAALLRLMDDTIELSRLRSGDATLDTTAFDLQAALLSCADAYREAASEKGLVLTQDFQPGTEGRWVGDAARIKRIVSALLSNSVKFTERGSISISLSFWGEGGVRVTVDDSGPGVPQGRRDEVFELFTQADESATRAAGGLGQGLALVRASARAMGGDAGVTESALGGARFYVLTPLLKLPGAAARPDAEPVAGRSRTPSFEAVRA